MAKAGKGSRRTGPQPAFALAALAAALIGLGGSSIAQQPSAQGAPSAVPVSVGKVIRQDVPLWLRELGTVQAFYSVLLRPKVDGTLLQVPVAEGQEVKQGDVLFEIDSRPYREALRQTEATVARDRAAISQAQAMLLKDTATSKTP